MSKKDYGEKIEVPQGLEMKVEGSFVTVKGEKGETTKALDNPKIKITVKEGNVLIAAKAGTQKEKKVIFSFKAHILNMFKGVQEGHTYKLKICSGHFPMSVAVKGDVLEVKNFIGESVPRTLNIKEGAEVKVDGDQIVVTGVSKEIVAQTAASIEKLTKRVGFDKRIFMDGIWIVEKDGVALG